MGYQPSYLQTNKEGKTKELESSKGNTCILSKYSVDSPTPPSLKTEKQTQPEGKKRNMLAACDELNFYTTGFTEPEVYDEIIHQRSEAYDEDYEEITVRIQQKD